MAGKSSQLPLDSKASLRPNPLVSTDLVVLTTDLLLKAYAAGCFPMAINAMGDLAWFSPDPRALIPLDDRFHLPHGLRRALKKNPFAITINRAFPTVMEGCATTHGDTWISPEILRSYTELHKAGHAHSIEVWRDDALVGGLYGVHLGGAFFGESMFHRTANASGAALVFLVEHLRQRDFKLLDTQWMTPHLSQFGTYLVTKARYLGLLAKAVASKREFLASPGIQLGGASLISQCKTG